MKKVVFKILLFIVVSNPIQAQIKFSISGIFGISNGIEQNSLFGVNYGFNTQYYLNSKLTLGIDGIKHNISVYSTKIWSLKGEYHLSNDNRCKTITPLLGLAIGTAFINTPEDGMKRNIAFSPKIGFAYNQFVFDFAYTHAGKVEKNNIHKPLNLLVIGLRYRLIVEMMRNPTN